MTPLLFFFACLFSGTLIPVPEDATLLAAGVMVVDLRSLVQMWIAGVVGLFLRDGAFYSAGRVMGEGIFRVPLVVRVVGQERITAARARMESWGSRAVLGARLAFGMRSAVFLTAGALGVPVRTFVVWDLLALIVWVPLALLVGAVVREPVLAGLSWVQEHPLLVLSMGGLLVASWSTSEMVRRSERSLHTA